MTNRLVSALTVVFISGILNALIYLLYIANSPPELAFLLIMSVVGGLVILAVTVVWGLPLHFLLERKKANIL